eukprot:6569622-Prorocentrum_lima.AAC.1
MTSSLVGSEMCIRDRMWGAGLWPGQGCGLWPGQGCRWPGRKWRRGRLCRCLLYTSDAADDM